LFYVIMSLGKVSKMKQKIWSQIYFVLALLLIMHPGWFSVSRAFGSEEFGVSGWQSVPATNSQMLGVIKTNLAGSLKLSVVAGSQGQQLLADNRVNCLATSEASKQIQSNQNLQPVADLNQIGLGQNTQFAQNSFEFNPESRTDCFGISLGIVKTQNNLAVINVGSNSAIAIQVQNPIVRIWNLQAQPDSNASGKLAAITDFSFIKFQTVKLSNFSAAAKIFIAPPGSYSKNNLNLALLGLWRC